MKRFEYKVLDTGRDIEARLNELGTDGWEVVGVTTKKQLLISPPAATPPLGKIFPSARGGEGWLRHGPEAGTADGEGYRRP